MAAQIGRGDAEMFPQLRNDIQMPHGEIPEEAVQHHDVGTRAHRDVVEIHSVNVDFWHAVFLFDIAEFTQTFQDQLVHPRGSLPAAERRRPAGVAFPLADPTLVTGRDFNSRRFIQIWGHMTLHLFEHRQAKTVHNNGSHIQNRHLLGQSATAEAGTLGSEYSDRTVRTAGNGAARQHVVRRQDSN